MAHFAQRFSFDLPHAFARHVEHFSDFLQGSAVTVVQTETQQQHFAFPLRQRPEYFQEHASKQIFCRRIKRIVDGFILDKVSDATVFAFAGGALERNGMAGDIDDAFNVLGRQF